MVCTLNCARGSRAAHMDDYDDSERSLDVQDESERSLSSSPAVASFLAGLVRSRSFLEEKPLLMPFSRFVVTVMVLTKAS